jgi:hypothetical protein
MQKLYRQVTIEDKRTSIVPVRRCMPSLHADQGWRPVI